MIEYLLGMGFKADEVMSGEHRFEAGYGPVGRHPLEFKGTWGPEKLIDWLDPVSDTFMTQPFDGTISIGELCEDVPCSGTLRLGYFDEHNLVYTLDFSVDGKDYQYVGEKKDVKLWKPWELPKTHTTCYGELRDGEGNLVSKSTTHFRLNSVVDFLKSFRLK